jgi:DNA-binding XRE family transcriptional regulator
LHSERFNALQTAKNSAGETMNTLGKHIAKLRKERKISREVMADLCGTTRVTIDNIEVDRYALKVPMLLSLCEVLEVTPNELLRWEGEVCAA